MLTELSHGDLVAVNTKPSLAESLGQWLGWADAIALSAALGGGSAVTAQGSPQMPGWVQAVSSDAAGVKATLARAVATDEVLAPRPVRATPGLVAGPTAGPMAPLDSVTAFAPLRRRHAAHQQAMAASVAPLRARVRAALTAASPQLGRLAALDAVMEEALGARERHLLSSVTPCLDTHFDRRCRAHHQQAGPTQAPDATWWAERAEEVRAVLLAELDIRWQPVDGLLRALDPEITRSA